MSIEQSTALTALIVPACIILVFVYIEYRSRRIESRVLSIAFRILKADSHDQLAKLLGHIKKLEDDYPRNDYVIEEVQALKELHDWKYALLNNEELVLY